MSVETSLPVAHPYVDTAAATAIVASLLGWLPPIAALLAIVWYCVLLWDRFMGPRTK